MTSPFRGGVKVIESKSEFIFRQTQIKEVNYYKYDS